MRQYQLHQFTMRLKNEDDFGGLFLAGFLIEDVVKSVGQSSWRIGLENFI